MNWKLSLFNNTDILLNEYMDSQGEGGEGRGREKGRRKTERDCKMIEKEKGK